MSTNNNRIHLGFYCSSTSWGGLEMNHVIRAVWMIERGYEVTYFGVADSPIERHCLEENIPFIAVKRNKKAFDLGNAIKVGRLFRKHAVSIAFITDNRDISIMGWVKSMCYSKLKIFYHQAMQLSIKKKDVIHTLRFGKIDAWMTPLPYMKAQIQNNANFPMDRVYLQPYGIDPQRIAYAGTMEEARQAIGIPKEGLVIGILGRIDPLKGQLEIINAFGKIADQNESAQLLIMGESTHNEGDDFLQLITARIEELKLGSRIFIRPFNKDVGMFFKAIDIFVMGTKGETYGMVTVEALMSGTPAIGTNAAGTPELLEHGKCGLLYDHGNETQLAEAMMQLLSDDALRSSLGQTAKHSAHSKYTRAIEEKSLNNIFKKLMDV